MKLLLNLHHRWARRRLIEKLARRFASVKRAKAIASRIP